MNCPQLAPQLYPGPPRQRLPKEYPSSSGNHRDLRLGQNDSDADYGDCDNQIDDNDEDDCDDHSNDNDDDDEDSDIDMEVDDDFRKFLEQSEKHRQEREQSKLMSIEPFFDAHCTINVHDCIIIIISLIMIFLLIIGLQCMQLYYFALCTYCTPMMSENNYCEVKM